MLHCPSGSRSATMSFMRIAISLLVVALLGCGSTPRGAESPMLGKTVSFDLPDDSGALVHVPLDDKITVLDFWATWCAPCRESVPALLARESDLQATGAKIVLVGVLADDESIDKARSTLESWGVKAPFLVDRGGVAQAEAGVRDLPATVILRAGGVVHWVAPKGATAAQVLSAVP